MDLSVNWRFTVFVLTLNYFDASNGKVDLGLNEF